MLRYIYIYNISCNGYSKHFSFTIDKRPNHFQCLVVILFLTQTIIAKHIMKIPYIVLEYHPSPKFNLKKTYYGK